MKNTTKRLDFVLRILFLFIYATTLFVPLQTAAAAPAQKAQVNDLAQSNSKSGSGIFDSLSHKLTKALVSSTAAPGPEPSKKGFKVASQDLFTSKEDALSAAPLSGQYSSLLASAPPSSHSSFAKLSITPITAYNAIVDSNVLSPSSYGPNSATLGAKYCNTDTAPMTDVIAYIGDRTNKAGVYPALTAAQAVTNTGNSALTGMTYTDYGGDPALVGGKPFSLRHQGGSAGLGDATRYLGTLAAGECRTVYWLVSYPRLACTSSPCSNANPSAVDVTGGVKPGDDLYLQYDFWGTGKDSGGAAVSEWYTRYLTMRNEISAMANKIWPNGDNKVPDEYVAAIQQVTGWSTWVPGGTGTVAYPGQTATSQGIWYDFGNVGAGFDNNYDFTPDRNAWVQPIGDAGSYDPGCFRLTKTYGLVIVKLTDGTDLLIPFVDQMYFENIPGNNTGVVGLVYYEYTALDGACSAGLTPYQEVASGYDNEKFNADFGSGIPPLQSQQTNMTMDKTGSPSSVGTSTNVTYTLKFGLPPATSDTSSTFISVGSPSLGMPLVFSDAIPAGMTFVNPQPTISTVTMTDYKGVASSTLTASMLYSTDSGATWSSTMPSNGTLSNPSTGSQIIIQWWLPEAITQNSQTSNKTVYGQVSFAAKSPSSNPPPTVTNTGCLKIGNGPSFKCDDETTLIGGNYNISGNVFCDDGTYTGGSPCNTGSAGGTLGNGLRDNTTDEPAMNNVKLTLYYDVDGNNKYDPTIDSFISSTPNVDTSGNYCFGGTLSGGVCSTTAGTGYPNGSYLVVVDVLDPDIPTGYTNTSPDTRGPDIASANVTGVNFAFAPALTIDKTVMPYADTSGNFNAMVNDLLTYSITVRNNIPGAGEPVTYCQYKLWASSINSNRTGTGVAGWSAQTYAFGPPDERYAYTDMSNNPDNIGLSGMTLGNFGGNITHIYYIVDMHERKDLAVASQSDKMIVYIYSDLAGTVTSNAAPQTDTYYADGTSSSTDTAPPTLNTYFSPNGGTGVAWKIIRELDAQTLFTGRTSATNWQWSDLDGRLQLEIVGNGIGSGNGDINLDAAGFIVVTDRDCSDPGQVIGTLPLTDVYDDVTFDYVSSDPPISNLTTPTGTLNWDNIGPLYPGQSKTVTVYLRPTQADTTSPYATNNVSVDSTSKFLNGRETNHPSDEVDVRVDTGRTLSGLVWFDINHNGWLATNGPGPDTSPTDGAVPNVKVNLLACLAGDGSMITSQAGNVNSNCGERGGTWIQVASQYTAATVTGTLGSTGAYNYQFTNLRSGYYRVAVDTATLPATTATFYGQTADLDETGNTRLCTTCDSQYGLATSDLTSTSVADLYTASKVDVNFGYDYPAMVFGKVWENINGNRIEDTGEPPLSGITVGAYVWTDDGDNVIETGEVATSPALTDTTNADGYYYIDDLTSAKYVIKVVETSLPYNTSGKNTWLLTDEDKCTTPVTLNCATDDTITGLEMDAIGFTTPTNATYGSMDFGYTRTGTGTIGDTLFFDVDGDSFQDTYDAGIPNVDVRLYIDVNQNGILDTADVAYDDPNTAGDQGLTTTDANGKYCFGATVANCATGGNLPLRSYIVKVITTDPDFPDKLNPTLDPDERNVDGNATNDPDQCATCDNLSSVTVTEMGADNTIETEDFGYFFRGPGSIGDTVYYDKDGNGTQSGTSETGIPNITVKLELDVDGSGTYVQIATTSTDSSGKYSFNNLPVSLSSSYTSVRYRVTVDTADTDIPKDLLGYAYIPTTATSFTPTLSSASPTYTTADFGFAPLAAIGDTVYNDVNGNGTQDAGEPGIGGVTVTLQTYTDANNNGRYDPGESSTGTSVTTTTTYKVIDGKMDVNGDGVIDTVGTTDNGTIGTCTVVKGLVTSGCTTYNGYSIISQYIDVDGDGTTSGDTDDDLEAGKYIFTGLMPNSAGQIYVVAVTSVPGLPSATSRTYLSGDPSTDGFSCLSAAPNPLNNPADSGEPSSAVCDAKDGMRLYYGTNYMGADFGYQMPGSVGDTVWMDVNNNGIRDYLDANANHVQDLGEPFTEAGIPNLTVTLLPCGNDNDCSTTGDNGVPITTLTNPDGNYFFTSLTNGTYRITVNTTTNWPSGLNTVPVYDPDASKDSQTTIVVSGGSVSAVGTCTNSGGTPCDPTGDGDPLNLDADFGYQFSGGTILSGTICLESVATTNGVCGGANTDYSVTSGVGTGETAYTTKTVSLYLWTDDGDGVVETGETVLVATTATDANGDYCFGGTLSGGVCTLGVGIPNDKKYVVSINAPQSGLDLSLSAGTDTTATKTAVNTSGDASTSQYVETLALDGSTLSAYQVVNTTSDTNVQDRDFAFTLKGSYDFSDLPVSYSTNLASVPDGARHLVPNPLAPTLYLGTASSGSVSTESDGQPSSAANLDTLDNGVRPIASSGSISAFSVDVVGSGWLVAWADINNDGDFADAGEMIISQEVSTGANQTITLSAPLPDTAEVYRFRLFPSKPAVPTLAYSGAATNGEVEDYVYDFNSQIGDRVWLDENADGIQDAGEVGIPNAKVTLTGTNAYGGTVSLTTYTDANGNYLFSNLAPSNGSGYTVTVDSTTLPSGLAANPTYDENGIGTAHTTNVILTAGEKHLTSDFGYNWSSPNETNNNTGTGAIGDRVWIDANGNGVQDPEEAGLSGVTVELSTGGTDGIFGTADDFTTPTATTTTNAAGNYIFDGLAAGTYAVRINGGVPAGYNQTGDPDHFGAGSGTNDGKTTTSIILAPGDTYINADFGYQPTTAGTYADIGDTVWLDANRNNSIDAGETLLANVTVSLIRDTNGNGTWDTGEPIIATDITDASGTYLFPRVPADGLGTYDYLVWVNDTQGILKNLTPTYDSNGTGTPNISAVTNLAASNLAQDFAYAPYGHISGEGMIGDTIFLDTGNGIAGGAPDGAFNAGEGIQGVKVQLYKDSNSDSIYNSGEALFATTYTDQNGNYFFGNLPAGKYIVKVDTATLPSGVTNIVDPDTASPGNSQSAVTLATGSMVNMAQDFGYRASTPHSISGTIWNDVNADGILSGETTYYPGVTVVLRNSSGSVIATTTTDASGNYTFGNLPDGTYTVDVTDTANVLNGLWHSSGSQLQTVDNTSKNDPYTVTLSGANVNTVDFGYFKSTSSISNLVWRDDNGNGIQDSGEPGIPGATVTLTIGTVTVKTITDSNGYYKFENLMLDESYTTGSVNMTVTVTKPSTGYEGYYPTLVNAGGNTATDSGDPGTGETTAVVRNTDYPTVDFGFKPVYNYGHLPSSGDSTIGPNDFLSNLKADGGASHLSDPTVAMLGSSVPTVNADKTDVEPNGGSSPGTNDTTFKMQASDNGINPTGTWTYGANGGSVNITAYCKTPNCFLVAWFDTDNNGSFETVKTLPINAVNYSGSMSFDIAGTGSSVNGTIYARFRLYSTDPGGSPSAYGASTSIGEVEDYKFTVKSGVAVSTPVTVSYFRAQRHGKNVDFDWSTATETGNVGFNLYVEDKNGLTQINTELIPSQAIDSLERLDYTFSAEVSGNVFYIEDISVSNEARQHGPFKLGEPYGDRLEADKIDLAAIQAEHEQKHAERQAELKQEITKPETAGAKPNKDKSADDDFKPTQTPKPTDDVKPTNAPKPTDDVKPDNTPTPIETATEAPAPKAADDVIPTEEPAPTEAPAQSASPTPSAVDLLDKLRASVIAYGDAGQVEEQNVTSLLSKIDAAGNSLEGENPETAVNQLNAFINEVEAQRGKKITVEAADDLIAQAQAIIDLLTAPPTTQTPIPTATTPAPTATATLAPTATATLAPTATATLEPTATATLEPTATNTPMPTATATLTPTATPMPMASGAVDPATLQLTTTLNLKVRKTGIYRVTYEMLRNSGLDLLGVPTTNIALINRGRYAPIYVETQTGSFGPGDYFDFYGEALDTIYTDTNVYTVQVSSVPVLPIQKDNAAPNPALSAPDSYPETLKVNNQRSYATSAIGVDPWIDTSMLVTTTAKSWNFTFQINSLVPSTSETLNLVVWGMSDSPISPDHHLQAKLNGVLVKDETFDGIVEHTLKIALPAGVLHEGTNTLQLTLPADTSATADLIMLDKFDVNYQRAFIAQNGSLNFTAAGDVFSVKNLPTADVVVYRMEAEGLQRLNNMNVQSDGTTYTATFAGTTAAATYLVTTSTTTNAPLLEAGRAKVDLNGPAQYLIITHPDFINGLQPLIQARQAQGLTVSVVDVTDLYTQYNYSIFDPLAIKQYIAYAARNLGTQYVLLVGGDTYDYRNYLGKNSISFIPSLYTSTGALANFIPTDPLYADVDGDKLPDLAIGRFPVRTTAELNMMVTKTLAYANKSYGFTSTFTSDLKSGTVSFKDISNNMSAKLPAQWTVQNIHLDDLGAPTAKTQLLAAMNNGTALVNFTGHSGPASWTFNNLFSITDATALTNTGKPFVAVQWGCWNTYYVNPVSTYLVQSLLFSGDKGAVAVFGATSLASSESEEMLGGLLIPRLVTPGATLGQALQDAKYELAQKHPKLTDVLLGWSLMGDPALIIVP